MEKVRRMWGNFGRKKKKIQESEARRKKNAREGNYRLKGHIWNFLAWFSKMNLQLGLKQKPPCGGDPRVAASN